MEKDKKWRLVNTKMTCELNLVKSLMHKGVQSFCPQCDYRLFENDKPTVQRRPLFPGMLFVYVTNNEISSVMGTKNITNILYWRNSMAEVAEKDISLIYNFTKSFANIALSRCPIIPSSTLTDYIMPEATDNNKVITRLHSIGYQLIAETKDALFKSKDKIAFEETCSRHMYNVNTSFRLGAI